MSEKFENNIDAALSSLDGLVKAEPQPYLLTRINARMSRTSSDTIWAQIAFYLKKPLVAGVAILLLSFTNFIVIKNINAQSEKENIAKSALSHKEDFAISVSVLYDIENQEP